MFGSQFYNQSIRKYVVMFGNMFNDIVVQRLNNSGTVIQSIAVPIAYGPKEKFLVRISQDPNLDREVALQLPRMGFEVVSYTYDSTRRLQQTIKNSSVSTSDSTVKNYQFTPVPYNIGVALSIFVQNADDGAQILEQILPFFGPEWTNTVNLIPSMNIKMDIPTILNDVAVEDTYEGDFVSRRALIYTLNFTAKTYLFGPVADTPEGIIKKVQLDYHTNMDRENKRRELRYVATPKAVKDYDNDNTATLTFNIGKNEVRITVNDSTNFSVGDRIVIDSEVMKVESKPDATTLAVKRGFSSTAKAEHLENSKINKLTTADDNLIEVGDDFGFSETSSIFTDSLQFNPATRTDS